MNISHPVSSQIHAVSFGFLTNEDIRALSVKRITSPTTFDTLLNPIPGGLYDLSLGQFGDRRCDTCGLKTPQCPGHCGHIDLPVPVYHPTFMDQMLRLLRGTCIYCSRLRLARIEVHKYICKLRLINCGLINEANELEDACRVGTPNGPEEQVSGSDDEELATGADTKALIERREQFVKACISRASRNASISGTKSEAKTIARRAIIAEFLASLTKNKKCKNCGGINHTYRKDGFVKIFRKGLSEKDRLAMIQSGHSAKDPVLEQRKTQNLTGRKRKRDEDEGIADMEQSSDEDLESVEGLSGEDIEIAGGNELVDDASTPAALRDGAQTKKAKAEEEYLNPRRVLAQLSEMFEREQDVLDLVYGDFSTSTRHREPRTKHVKADMFFIHALIVPPNRYRPENHLGDGHVAESGDNTHYTNILKICDVLTTIQRELSGFNEPDEPHRGRTYADLETTWTRLQDAVNSMIDRDRNPLQGAAGKRNVDGVKQKLEKKTGMFRKYMMGKRVNFAARTVISPDPNIETNEIGVPPVFAKKLTYPEPVTNWNFEALQEAVRNGPDEWPGAVAIEDEHGRVVKLERKNAEERTALANQLLAPTPGSRGSRGKKVHRHLNNGDIVIMNRQPTLHKPSMMCHRAKVLPGEKTLRMHYSNCNTYNADFDGDEMNLHFPQNELARAEALTIADTDHQYLSSTAGNPLRGLIQDHISISVALCSKDSFFSRQEYQELLYSALRPENGHCATGRVETIPPAIMKPKPLWTGKQVITTVLLNVKPNEFEGLTFEGKSTTPAKMWGNSGSEEGTVVVKGGYLCQGILDKKQIGPSSGGLVNGVYELYGHTVAGKLLSILGRLLTRMLVMRAHSCGVEDLIFTAAGEKQRREAMAPAVQVGREIAQKFVVMSDKDLESSGERELLRRLEDVTRDDDKLKVLDSLAANGVRKLASNVTDTCLPVALVKPFPKNQMQAMTSSGAKGSGVNANQISCNLGQQTLEGRRVPVMVSGKTLPCFKPFEPSVRAGGFIVDRFLTGVRPQEYYFHAMAGREGLIDTAVKTSSSGYLQRCLIKGMEGLKVEHDTSVRDADGSIVQFLYGEDGLDVAKSKYLEDFRFTADNHLSTFQGFGENVDFNKVISFEAAAHNKAVEKTYRKTGDLGASDPTLSVYWPSRQAGATSERIFRAAHVYADENPDRLIRDKKKGIEGVLAKKGFQRLVEMKYFKSVVEAGEAVGVVAGQSVGEPSTQMTLNTFHLAGHAAKNVTLGIPRLREILMTAAVQIRTPQMVLRLNEDIEIDKARSFAKGISNLPLAHILDKAEVTESIAVGTAYASAKRYTIKLDFYPSKDYMQEYAITVDDVATTLEYRFLPKLQSRVRKELKKRSEEKDLKTLSRSDALPELGKSVGAVEQEPARTQREGDMSDAGSDDEADDDATRDKAKRNRQQAGYEAYEDTEEMEIAEMNRQSDAMLEEAEIDDEAYGSDSGTSSDSESAAAKGAAATAAQDRELRIRSAKGTNDVASFAFDDEGGSSCTFTLEYDASTAKVLMLQLVENAARAALVQSVPNISDATVDEEATKNAGNAAVIVTSGVNIPAMWNFQHAVDPDHIYTNDVHHFRSHYGVEGARAVIVRELQAVFGSHSISVDPRHLTLIADYMTRDGGYQAFSRMGYRGNPSPFMKMSFETSVGFLKDAVLDGDWDDLTNPSARIVAGRLNRVGTGGFDVLMPVTEQERMDSVSDVEPEAMDVD